MNAVNEHRPPTASTRLVSGMARPNAGGPNQACPEANGPVRGRRTSAVQSSGIV